jgi:hypothetical protein
VVADTILRYHASPVHHVCIVSEGEDARRWQFGWEEVLGPWARSSLGSPGLFAVAGQAVYEDDTDGELSVICLLIPRRFAYSKIASSGL